MYFYDSREKSRFEFLTDKKSVDNEIYPLLKITHISRNTLSQNKQQSRGMIWEMFNYLLIITAGDSREFYRTFFLQCLKYCAFSQNVTSNVYFVFLFLFIFNIFQIICQGFDSSYRHIFYFLEKKLRHILEIHPVIMAGFKIM